MRDHFRGLLDGDEHRNGGRSRPNPWLAWTQDHDVGPATWMLLTAQMLRDVPIDLTANRLAMGLAVREISEAGIVMEMLEEPEKGDREVVDWAFWLERWYGNNGTLNDGFIRDLTMEWFRSFDTELHLDWQDDGSGRATYLALLWFLLVAIRGWGERTTDLGAIKPGTRWILELNRGERADADPIAALLAHFYDRFKAGGYAPTRPLPDTLAIDPPLAVRGVKPRRDKDAGH